MPTPPQNNQSSQNLQAHNYSLFPNTKISQTPNFEQNNHSNFAGMAFTLLDSIYLSDGAVCHDVDNLESAGFTFSEPSSLPSLPISSGFLNKKPVSVLRDTGCFTVGVRSSLIPASSILPGRSTTCITFNGDAVTHKMARVHIESPYFSGTVVAYLCDNPVADVIIGNIKDALLPNSADFVNLKLDKSMNSSQCTGHVVTRSQSGKSRTLPPLQVNNTITPLELLPSDFAKLQSSDVTLSPCFRKANNHIGEKKKKGSVWYFIKDDLLYRKFTSNSGAITHQLVVPISLRQKVLALGHDTIMAGHMGCAKTIKRILNYFFWPGLSADAKRFCTSCDICQKVVSSRKPLKSPLYPLPIIKEPFVRVAIDTVGPIDPPSSSGYRYILTFIDYTTTYPEAIPLKTLQTVEVADALMQFFSRLGIPEEILTDNGSQFTSGLFSEVMDLLLIQHLRTSPYHAATNGLVERFNGTLKKMLSKLVSEQPQNWDRFINPLLFAYREVPQDSTGFSPFELLYGRTPRGPLSLLYSSWKGTSADQDIISWFFCDRILSTHCW